MDLASRLLGGNSNKRLGSNLLRRTTNSNKQTKIQIIRNPMHIQKRKYNGSFRSCHQTYHNLYTGVAVVGKREFAVFKDYLTQDLFTFSI